MEEQILETAIATLAGIIRSSSLSDVANRSQPFYHKPEKEKMPEELEAKGIDDEFTLPSAPPFFQHVHDEFIQQLHDHVLDAWG